MSATDPAPLTLEEHRELGTELRKTRSRMHELCRLVDELYGPNNRATFAFVKLTEAMDRLCADMQTQAERDVPGHETSGFYS